MSRGVIGLELTKGGRRREVPLNGDSDRTLVGLGPKADGRVFKTRSIQTFYNNAVQAAKLDDVNFHTLRHTFASWAVIRGVTLKELLGHASLAMTTRYAHLAPEHLRRLPVWRGYRFSTRFGFSASLSARASSDRGGASEVAAKVGSPGWSRTSDFLINSQALYQLSYRGVSEANRLIIIRPGPPAYTAAGVRPGADRSG